MADVKKYGATGDGKTDDTAAIQKAVDACPAAGTVTVPKGKYMVDAAKGVSLKSDMTFKMFAGAELRVIPNSLWNYSTLKIWGVKNVKVIGGRLVGDRVSHKPKAKPGWKPSAPWNKFGEWGMGVDIRGSENVTVEGTAVHNMWGDGFYVSDNKSGKVRKVVLKGVTADFNRRQGLSVIAVHDLQVLNSIFRNTKGTRPAAGIDFEPDLRTPRLRIENVLIKGCRFFKNQGAGVEFAVKKGITRNVNVTGCSFGGNNKAIKSSTFSWWQNLLYSIFGWPTSLKI